MDDVTKSFLEKIQELKEKKTKVDVVSSNKKIDVSLITFKQQKDLISTVADGPAGIVKFQKVLNEVLLENTGNDELKIIDKAPITIKLRIDSIGNILENGEKKLDLNEILTKTKKLKYRNSDSYEYMGIKLNVEIPTLKEENLILQSTIDALKKANDNDVSKSVGDIFTYEVIKFIKSIEIAGEVLDLSTIHVKDRVKLVENLPSALNKNVVDFIQELKKTEREYLTIGEEEIEISVSLFDS